MQGFAMQTDGDGNDARLFYHGQCIGTIELKQDVSTDDITMWDFVVRGRNVETQPGFRYTFMASIASGMAVTDVVAPGAVRAGGTSVNVKVGDRLQLKYDPRFADVVDHTVTVIHVYNDGNFDVRADGTMDGDAWTVLQGEISRGEVAVAFIEGSK